MDLSLPTSHPKHQIVRALEHLHSKLSVIHRGQCLDRLGRRGLASHTRPRGPAGPAVPRLWEATGRDVPAASRPLSTPLSHSCQPPGPVPVLFPGAQSMDRVDLHPGTRRPAHLVLTCCLRVEECAGGMCTTARIQSSFTLGHAHPPLPFLPCDAPVPDSTDFLMGVGFACSQPPSWANDSETQWGCVCPARPLPLCSEGSAFPHRVHSVVPGSLLLAGFRGPFGRLSEPLQMSL